MQASMELGPVCEWRTDRAARNKIVGESGSFTFSLTLAALRGALVCLYYSVHGFHKVLSQFSPVFEICKLKLKSNNNNMKNSENEL